MNIETFISTRTPVWKDLEALVERAEVATARSCCDGGARVVRFPLSVVRRSGAPDSGKLDSEARTTDN